MEGYAPVHEEAKAEPARYELRAPPSSSDSRGGEEAAAEGGAASPPLSDGAALYLSLRRETLCLERAMQAAEERAWLRAREVEEVAKTRGAFGFIARATVSLGGG